MSNIVEAIRNTNALILEHHERFQGGELDKADSNSYLDQASTAIKMQLEYVGNTAKAVEDQAKKLLNSLNAKPQTDHQISQEK